MMAVVGIAGDDDDGEAGTAGTSPERRTAGAPRPAKQLDPLVSKAKISMMLGSAKFASGLADDQRDEIIAFFTDETGKKPTEVRESEVAWILAHFKKLAVGDDASDGVDEEVAA